MSKVSNLSNYYQGKRSGTLRLGMYQCKNRKNVQKIGLAKYHTKKDVQNCFAVDPMLRWRLTNENNRLVIFHFHIFFMKL